MCHRYRLYERRPTKTIGLVERNFPNADVGLDNIASSNPVIATKVIGIFIAQNNVCCACSAIAGCPKNARDVITVATAPHCAIGFEKKVFKAD